MSSRRLPGCVTVAVVIALAVVTGCGDDDTGNDGPITVQISDKGYDPAELKVEVGDRVVFVNRSKGPQSAKDDRGGDIEVSPAPGPTAHDGSEIAHATAKGFATHSLFGGERQTVVFGVPRTYEYYSAFNPDLRGRIEVVEKGDGE